MACEQSTRPEDTMAARQEGLTPDDFATEEPVRVCLTASEILAADDRKSPTWVPAPEWGGGVYLLTPGADDRERYERQQKTKRVRRGSRTVEQSEMNLDEMRERLLIDFCCDADGERLFKCTTREETRDTIAALKQKSAAVIGRIGDKVIELMGWSSDDLEEMVGNSETDRS